MAEYHRLERREVAAERGWRCNVLAAANAGGRSGNHVGALRVGDAIHLVPHAAGLELGHREFLVADRVCIYGTGAGFSDERGNPGSQAHPAPRSARGRRAHRGDVHRRDGLCARARAGSGRRSEKRRVSCHHRGVGGSEGGVCRHSSSAPGDGGERRWCWKHGGGNRPRAFCCGD